MCLILAFLSASSIHMVNSQELYSYLIATSTPAPVSVYYFLF